MALICITLISFADDKFSFLVLPENNTSTMKATHYHVTPFIYFVYVFTFVLSLVGNSVIIHIIRKDRTMRTTTNWLILSQACVDLYLTMINLLQVFVPFHDFKTLTHLWIGGVFGQITCKSFLASVVISPVFTGWILVPIAVERFYAVIRPFKSSPISQHLKKTIMSVYTWSVACSVNVMVNGVVVEINKYHYCGLPSGLTRIDIILSTFNISIILLIIMVLYTVVCHKLWSRGVPIEGINQNQRHVESNKKTAKKVTSMMITVVVLYILCWFPLGVLLILNYHGIVHISLNVYFFVTWLTVAFSGTNPYVYFAFAQTFRQAFKRKFDNFYRKCKIDSVLHCSNVRSERVDLESIERRN